MADAPRGNLPTLEVALVGTLAMASMICLRLWFIMSDIRDALTDPMAMAIIITDDSIKSDSARTEGMLNNARSSFADTEKVVGLFSVALALVAIALILRILRSKRATQTGEQHARQAKRKRPASR